MIETNGQGPRSFLFSKAGIAILGFSVLAGYFLWTEHEAHLRVLVPYLPFLLLLACPLMHLFMHHGHGTGAAHGKRSHGWTEAEPNPLHDGRHGDGK